MGLLNSKQQSYVIDNRSVTWKTYKEFCLYQVPQQKDDEEENKMLDDDDTPLNDERSIKEHLMIDKPQRRIKREEFSL